MKIINTLISVIESKDEILNYENNLINMLDEKINESLVIPVEEDLFFYDSDKNLIMIYYWSNDILIIKEDIIDKVLPGRGKITRWFSDKFNKRILNFSKVEEFDKTLEKNVFVVNKLEKKIKPILETIIKSSEIFRQTETNKQFLIAFDRALLEINKYGCEYNDILINFISEYVIPIEELQPGFKARIKRLIKTTLEELLKMNVTYSLYKINSNPSIKTGQGEDLLK